MRPIFRLRYAVTALVLSALSAAAADHEIVFHRPLKVGRKLRLTAQGTETDSSTATLDGRKVNEETKRTTLDLVADVVVRAVSPIGKARKETLTIRKLRAESVDGTVTELPAGAVVTAAVEGGKTVFTMNGAPVKDEVKAALAMAVSLGSDDVSDDDVFGTKERKVAGATWPVDAGKAADSLRAVGLEVARGQISGTVTFEGADEAAGVLQLGATMRIEGFRVPLPEGLETRAAEITVKQSGRFPVDRAGLPLSDSEDFSMAFTAEGRMPQGVLVVKGRNDRRVTRLYGYGGK